MRFAWLALAAFALLASPETASACAVCSAGQTEEVRYAFIWTTGFLSVLPLGLIGGVIWFLRRRLRELEARSVAPMTGAIEPGLRSSASRR